jgi:UDP-N-acetylglucosamine acyltransferase
VHETARLGEGVGLEPGALIGAGVELGDRSWVGARAVVYGPSRFGVENRIHAAAVLGGDPQDISFRGEPSRLEVGDRNVFREGVTVSRGSPKYGGVTRIGSDNYLMANSHIGHDCVVEDRCILSNDVLVAGHCFIQTGANFAGGSAMVQFTTVGRLAFLGGLAGARQDLEPFMIHDSSEGGIVKGPVAVNEVGLRRGNVPEATIDILKRAFRVLFKRESGETLVEARAELERLGLRCAELEELVEFMSRKRASRFGRHLESQRRRH